MRLVEAAHFQLHVTTPSSGSIVVLATFAEKFKGQGHTWLLALSAAGFIIAIAVAVLTALTVIGLIHDVEPQQDAAMRRRSVVAGVLAASAFAIALASLGIFAGCAFT